MADIKITKLSKDELKNMGVFSWPTWEKEASTFPWHYDSKETCYILEGKVKVTPGNGESVEFEAGDFVEFPEGMDCTWEINTTVKKHYKFD